MSACKHNLLQSSGSREHVSRIAWKAALSKFVEDGVGSAVKQEESVSRSLSISM